MDTRSILGLPALRTPLLVHVSAAESRQTEACWRDADGMTHLQRAELVGEPDDDLDEDEDDDDDHPADSNLWDDEDDEWDDEDDQDDEDDEEETWQVGPRAWYP